MNEDNDNKVLGRLGNVLSKAPPLHKNKSMNNINAYKSDHKLSANPLKKMRNSMLMDPNDNNQEAKVESYRNKTPKKLEENLSKEDGMIKGFLLNLMNKEDKDDYVDVNFEQSIPSRCSSKKSNTNLISVRKRRLGVHYEGNTNLSNKSLNTLTPHHSKSKFDQNAKKKQQHIELFKSLTKSEPMTPKTRKKRKSAKVSIDDIGQSIDNNFFDINFDNAQSNFLNNVFVIPAPEVNELAGISDNSLIQAGKIIDTKNDAKDTPKSITSVKSKKLSEPTDLKLQGRGVTFKGNLEGTSESNLHFITHLYKREQSMKSSLEIEKGEKEKVFDNSSHLKSVTNSNKSSAVKVNNFFEEDSINNSKYQSGYRDVNDDRIIKSFKNVYDSLSDCEDREDVDHIFNEKFDEDYFIIHPESNLKANWDYIILCSVLYCVFVYPFRIAFKEVFIHWNVYLFFDLLVDIIFIVDFVFNFFTPFYDRHENLIFDRTLIFKNYITNVQMFLIEIVASIFPLVIFSYLEIKSVQAIIVLLRFIRIFRSFEQNTHKGVMDNRSVFYRFLFSYSKGSRTFRYVLFFTVIIHVCSCLWILIGLLNDEEIMILYPDALPEFRETWIQRYTLESFDSFENKHNKFDIYVCSLYFTLTTIYTIGYGDIVSKNFVERLYNNLFMMVGVMLYSFALSNLSTTFAQEDKATKRFYKRMGVLHDIKKEYKLSDEIFKKIKKNLKYNFKQNHSRYCNENYKFLKSLPKNLKNEITISMYKKNLKDIHFFQEKYMNINYDFILSTLPYIVSTQMSRGEIIFKQGEIIDECYIIRKGCLSLYVTESLFSIEIAQISKNYNFGEILMYSNELSPFSLKVSSKFAELMVIKKEKFTKLKIKYPSIVSNILSEGWSFFNLLLKKKDYILDNIAKLDINLVSSTHEIRKQVRLLKMQFCGDDKQNMGKRNSNKLKSGFSFNFKNSSNDNIDVNNMKNASRNFRIDQQMEKIEKTLDEELFLIREIKNNKKSRNEIVDMFKIKKNNFKEDTNVKDQRIENISNNQNIEKKKKKISSKLIEQISVINTHNSLFEQETPYDHSKNTIQKSMGSKSDNIISSKLEDSGNSDEEENDNYDDLIKMKNKSFLKLENLNSFANQMTIGKTNHTNPSYSKNNSKKFITTTKTGHINLLNIENNINEHYLMMDQNLEMNKFDNTKDKLINLISQNKSLKKKLIRQATSVRDQFKKKSAKAETAPCFANASKEPDLTLLQKNVSSINSLYKKLKNIL